MRLKDKLTHVHVSIVRTEIPYFGSTGPRIPDNNILQILSLNSVQGPVSLLNYDSSGDVSVDTIDLACNSELITLLSSLSSPLNLVLVANSLEAGNSELGDILQSSITTLHQLRKNTHSNTEVGVEQRVEVERSVIFGFLGFLGFLIADSKLGLERVTFEDNAVH